MGTQNVIIFDGVCKFCNNSINFIIKRDHNSVFLFSPMQSEAAQDLIAKYNVKGVGFDTFLLIKNNECFYRTDAALEITKDLSDIGICSECLNCYLERLEIIFIVYLPETDTLFLVKQKNVWCRLLTLKVSFWSNKTYKKTNLF